MNLNYKSVIRVALIFLLSWVYNFASGVDPDTEEPSIRVCTDPASDDPKDLKITLFTDGRVDGWKANMLDVLVSGLPQQITRTLENPMPAIGTCKEINIWHYQDYIIEKGGAVHAEVGWIDAASDSSFQKTKALVIEGEKPDFEFRSEGAFTDCRLTLKLTDKRVVPHDKNFSFTVSKCCYFSTKMNQNKPAENVCKWGGPDEIW